MRYSTCRKCGGRLGRVDYCDRCGTQPDYRKPGGLLRVGRKDRPLDNQLHSEECSGPTSGEA